LKQKEKEKNESLEIKKKLETFSTKKNFSVSENQKPIKQRRK